MGIVGGFMVPHPPIIIPEIGRGDESGIASTINSYKRVADMVAEMKPDTIVISTPHSVMYSDYFHISPGETAEGSFSRFGVPEVGISADYDTAFVKKLCMLAAENGVDAGTGGEKDPKLDHGTLIPLYFVTQKYVDFNLVRIGLSGLPLAEHYRLGMLIKQAAEELNRRVVYIASGDLSHKLKEDGPYGFVPDGPMYEDRIMDVMGRAAFEELFDFDELFLEKVAECGHRSFVMMAGALDRTAVKVQSLSHEGPFGVGYGVCTYEVCADEDGSKRCFLDDHIRKDSERRYKQRENEDLLVRLARKSLETYIKERKEISFSDVGAELVEAYKAAVQRNHRAKEKSDGIAILDGEGKSGEAAAAGTNDGSADSVSIEAADEQYQQLISTRAGAFVSLHKDGRLRGCIGTISPARDTLAEEIIENAISASTRDPRFDPVTVRELNYLEYSVDVLSPAEPIDSPSQLDVKRYGVIVTNGGRRGLLLPNLDTIDTVEEQIAIAKRKAGIGEDEPVKLQRFEVVRHR